VNKKRNKRKEITQAKNKSTQAQVTQLTQAIIASYFSRNEHKRQSIGMVDRSSQSWLSVACGFRLRNARNASACVACDACVA